MTWTFYSKMETVINGRTCARCKAWKTAENFAKASKGSGSKSGLYAYCKDCRREYATAYSRERYANDPDFRRKRNAYQGERNKVAARKLRAEVIAAYGGKCACCDESTPEFLAIDHVNNDGAEHRRLIGASGSTATYAWLRRNGFPQDGFQLLCHNCNNAKAFYGQCPHQRDDA